MIAGISAVAALLLLCGCVLLALLLRARRKRRFDATLQHTQVTFFTHSPSRQNSRTHSPSRQNSRTHSQAAVMAELQNTLTGRRHTHRPPTHAQAADADADAAARIAISGGPSLRSLTASTTSTAQPPQRNASQARGGAGRPGDARAVHGAPPARPSHRPAPSRPRPAHYPEAVLRGDEQEEEEADEKMLEAGVGDSRGEVYV